MSDPDKTEETTVLLRRWTAGEKAAGEALFDSLYDELRRVASRRLRAESSGSLQTTALVHELFLRLVDQRSADWRDRAHFFAVAARLMRRILVDDARSRGAQKRGGEQPALSFESLGEVPFGERASELLALDDCIRDLDRRDPDKARLVELRFFGGLSLEDTAEVMGLSRSSVVRQWRLTKGWMHRQMQVR
ncbi:MAG: ECF-type sigma factor [Acidobacteriota bacterium]